MNVNKNNLLLAAGTCAALGASALAGPTVINISGATLFESFFRSPASTNDYIDANGAGPAGSLGTGVEQLAPFNLPPLPTDYWSVMYRATGSGNGLAELVSFNSTFVTADNTNGNPLAILNATGGVVVENAYYNRNKWKDLATGLQGIAVPTNPGAAPVRSNTSTLLATTDGSGGIRMDIAVMDVPTRWFVVKGTTAQATPGALPNTNGYGQNPRNAVTITGAATTQNNKLKSLGSLTLFDAANPPSPSSTTTVFDTPVATVPIAFITNLGTGKTQATYAELQHLFVAGRLPSGENLVAVTRDSGSGTRNGAMNSIAIDPSWGMGDNVGVKNDDPTFNVLGPDYLPDNKGGSGSLENSVINHRLAIGYSGAERGGGSGWLLSGKCELLAVKDTVNGGTQFVRPTVNAVLDNGLIGQTDPSNGTLYTADGYRVAGPETFATVGDPMAAPAAKGGYGWSVSDTIPSPARPQMLNTQAAAYINNITRSVAAFVAVPGGGETVFSPGEYLASSFILTAATDYVQDPLNPSNMILNTSKNQPLQNLVRSINVLGNPAFATFGSITLNGKVPTRKSGTTYTDGSDGFYHNMTGATVAYGTNLTSRNRIAGDFNADGLRNADDITDMVKAWRHRNTGGFVWTPPTAVGAIAGAPATDTCIEIIGDFNGDGNFNAADVRYFADGLALQTSGPNAGMLDRKAGFTAVDAAFAATAAVPPVDGIGNFFAATKATGGSPANRPWHNGDARGDVAGAVGTAPGAAPVGANGVIDAADIDYVFKQFQTNAAATIVPNLGKQVDWANLAQAATFDLSADMTGDRKVDMNDVRELVNVILLTNIGDLNFDGVVNAADLAIANAWIAGGGGGGSSRPGTYANGDVNGDGVVDAADIQIITRGQCIADITDLGGSGGPDGQITVDDLVNFLSAFFAGNLYTADVAVLGGTAGRDGQITVDDLVFFLSNFFAGCP